MRWGKILLLFQAAMTLMMGVAFFSQLTIIGFSEISDLTKSLSSGENQPDNPEQKIEDIRNRFTVASYLLLVIGLVEIIIILRLIS